jgi:DtxR family transcriptional regulator, Mn-dependent transcriptional regulator
MTRTDPLTASLQCYLAAIRELESEQQSARPSMIAEKCGVHRSSVTAALRSLADRAMIRYEAYGSIGLTPRGEQAAEEVLTRRRVIREFLIAALGIEADLADDAACRMQSSVPAAVIARMTEWFSVRPKPVPG